MYILNKSVIVLLRFYKQFISPILPPACRYSPSCSEYAMEAFQNYTFFKACRLSGLRILRCNPLFPGGIDPVPEPKMKQGYKNGE